MECSVADSRDVDLNLIRMEPINDKTWAFIDSNRGENLTKLALKKAPEDVNLQRALQQLKGIYVVSQKVPTWSFFPRLEYPKQLSLEQCSSEVTARYKGSLVAGDSMTDLTGGMGVDCFFIGQNFARVVYIERQEELCKYAKHNFTLLGKPIAIHNTEATSYIYNMNPVDLIYADPARRDKSGNKVVTIADCEPNLKELLPLLRARATTIMIKLSPMLDINKALNDLSGVSEVHVIAVNNECKEVILLLKQEKQPLSVTCVNLNKEYNGEQGITFDWSHESEAEVSYSTEVKQYLYEPNAALLKAGMFKSVAEYYGLEKLQQNSHLYTSERLIEHFEGRIFEVEGYSAVNKRGLEDLLVNESQINVTIRNFPSTVEEVRKKFKLKDGGNKTMFLTTIGSDHLAILCRKAVTV